MYFPFAVDANLALLLLRVAVGATFIGHGRMKMAAWKSKEKKPMDGMMKFLSVVEPLGGLALVLGFLTPWAGLGLALIMVGALYYQVFVWKKAFSALPAGWEFDAVLLTASVALIAFGAGAYSVDMLLK